ncbi:hypothetical protein [Edaphobacter flagellatus]|nr:hypothetical protein [Edaphobacter flagellatus]
MAMRVDKARSYNQSCAVQHFGLSGYLTGRDRFNLSTTQQNIGAV